MFHNLLTKENKKTLQREYLMRTGSVFAFAIAAAVFSGIAALFPAHIGLRTDLAILLDEATRHQAEVAEDVERPFETLADTARLVTRVDTALSAPPVTDGIALMLTLRPATVAITAMSLERDPSRISIEGTAATREALVGYVRALRESPRFESVTDPISDLARSTDLAFRLQFTMVSEEE